MIAGGLLPLRDEVFPTVERDNLEEEEEEEEKEEEEEVEEEEKAGNEEGNAAA